MLKLEGNRLVFTFPEVHAEAHCEIEFQRTLRIPDDGKTYPLPPGLGQFTLKHVDDFTKTLDAETLERGGVMLPMYQSEALWIRFNGKRGIGRGSAYPFAVKIAAGKRSAVTGDAWSDGLNTNDYVIIPLQPWIDGFVISEGKIRQFVASPLGMGFTVEEQLTDVAEFGGLQIEVFPMKAEEYERRFPHREEKTRGGIGPRGMGMSGGALGSGGWSGTSSKRYALSANSMSRGATLGDQSRGDGDDYYMPVRSMGMAAGGSMKQEIYKDPYGLHVWDQTHKARTFVHLMNSMAWKQITGLPPMHPPPTAAEYNRQGLPWFDYYGADEEAFKGTANTDKIKSVAQLSKEKGYTILPENQPSEPQKVVGIQAPKVKGQVTDGKW